MKFISLVALAIALPYGYEQEFEQYDPSEYYQDEQFPVEQYEQEEYYVPEEQYEEVERVSPYQASRFVGSKTGNLNKRNQIRQDAERPYPGNAFRQQSFEERYGPAYQNGFTFQNAGLNPVLKADRRAHKGLYDGIQKIQNGPSNYPAEAKDLAKSNFVNGQTNHFRQKGAQRITQDDANRYIHQANQQRNQAFINRYGGMI